jgi:gamma-butyrobetaine dioxygenase
MNAAPALSTESTVEIAVGAEVLRFPAVWLRDNCDCAACVDRGSGQKLFGIEDLPEDLSVTGVEASGDAVIVHFGPDGHRGWFTREWLADHRLDADPVDPRTEDAKTLWRAADIDLATATGSWPRFADDPAHRAHCLDALLRLGFVRLTEVPVRPDEVLAVAAGFGFVRETNYGRRFDVMAVPEATNLAFTDQPITPHTDNPYRDPVPTLQLLHCLANEADGGDSGLVDGFAVAAGLRAADPVAFELLTRTPVTFRYRADGVDLAATAPLIGLDARGRIRAIRYNNRSTQPVRLRADEVPAFYAAYRRFAVALADPAWQLNLRLAPGDCLIFDNTRLLHARTGFSGAGRRHLQGCYADVDAAESQWRVLDGA